MLAYNKIKLRGGGSLRKNRRGKKERKGDLWVSIRRGTNETVIWDPRERKFRITGELEEHQTGVNSKNRKEGGNWPGIFVGWGSGREKTRGGGWEDLARRNI